MNVTMNARLRYPIVPSNLPTSNIRYVKVYSARIALSSPMSPNVARHSRLIFIRAYIDD
jgi:hypothetical protein